MALCETSPTGWYCVSYLARFIHLNDTKPDDEERRWYAWENTVLIEADSPESALEKGKAVGIEHAKPYKAGEEGIMSKWEFLGITDVTAIHEELKDGAEIAFREHKRKKLKNLRKLLINQPSKET